MPTDDYPTEPGASQSDDEITNGDERVLLSNADDSAYLIFGVIAADVYSVPVYDFSDLSFDFQSDLIGHRVSNRIPRMSREGPSNSPAVVAYYPSFYTKEGKTIVNMNIKWVGVI